MYLENVLLQNLQYLIHFLHSFHPILFSVELLLLELEDNYSSISICLTGSTYFNGYLFLLTLLYNIFFIYYLTIILFSLIIYYFFFYNYLLATFQSGAYFL